MRPELALRQTAVALLAIAMLACARRVEVRSAPAAVGTTEPSTDIYLYRLARGLLPRDRLTNVTKRRGYDNQPAWDGGSILFTAQSAGQTDIHRYRDGGISPVTNTPESEYSPSLMPDGKGISVVRVERDSTQRLWRFPNDGGTPSVILEAIKPVGYYAWLDSTTLALYVLGSPNTLRIADTRTGTARVVATAIERSLQRVPGGSRASFVQQTAGSWVLRTVDPRTLRVDSLAVLPDSAQYVAWRSDRVLYSAGGSRIWRLELPGSRWNLVVDLAGRGIHHITRLALSPDGRTLAFVADEP